MLRPSPAATADLAGVFRFPSMRGLFLPRNARPWRAQSNSDWVLNFFFYQVPPLQAALWQRRSEPVKALRCASTADAAPAAAWTEPSAPLPRRKCHEAGALNKRNLGFRQCSPSCTQIAPQRAANEEQSHANHYQQHSLRRQQWHNRYQQRRAAQE